MRAPRLACFFIVSYSEATESTRFVQRVVRDGEFADVVQRRIRCRARSGRIEGGRRTTRWRHGPSMQGGPTVPARLAGGVSSLPVRGVRVLLTHGRPESMRASVSVHASYGLPIFSPPFSTSTSPAPPDAFGLGRPCSALRA